MSVFEMFPSALVPATLYPVRRKASGAEMSAGTDLFVIFDEGSSVGLGGVEQEQSSNVLIYGRPQDFTHNVIGSIIEVQGKKYRIASFNMAKNQHTGTLEHIEMSGEAL